ncbi:hypothetical protein FQR65_LT06156 [Abscondita terminalis]|nr:hypothetical protein FQR65_LT06156 [Abscondita terminalis]
MEYMEQLFLKMMKNRRLNPIKRNDFIDILNELTEHDSNYKFDDENLASLAVTFLVAGYETTASVLSYVWYELACNKDIQARLRNEVQEALQTYKEFSYEAIAKMDYLEMVINETLRKYPLIGFVDRVCAKDYTVPNTKLVIEKGTGVYISVRALHFDQQYFPNPENFDPERFSVNNKNAFPEFAYMPFGKGFRACIGGRFAILGLKVAVAKTVINFQIDLSKDTPCHFRLIHVMWIFLVLFFIFLIVYLHLSRNFNYWKKRNVPYVKPVLIFGSIFHMAKQKLQLSEVLKELHESTMSPYIGFFILDQPFILFRDLELIKRVIITDFDYFIDRTITTNERDSIGSKALFTLKGETWKELRKSTSPLFSMNKLKNMVPLMNGIGNKVMSRVERSLEDKSIDCRSVSLSYAIDVISSCVFGLETNALLNEHSVFIKAVLKLLEITIVRVIHLVSCFFAPMLVNLFNFTLTDAEATITVTNIFNNVCKDRRNSGIHRGDLIDIMNKIKIHDNPKLNDEYTAALAIQILLAGYETTGTVISFLMYELCLHVDIQNRLRKEIKDVLCNNYRDISHEDLNKMEYMDMVIKETLRKYPVLGFLDRRCVKSYKVPDTDLIIEKGIPVYISVLALHYDERYYPNPEKFDPERFSAANKLSRPTSVYMPFGEGPRQCLVVKQNQSVSEMIQSLYLSTTKPYLGFFIFDQPFLLIRDLDLIKKIVVTDFDYFPDRIAITNKKDSIGSKLLFLLKGEEWKQLRKSSTPLFSLNKLKNMVPLINEVGENLVQHIEKHLDDYSTDCRSIGLKAAIDAISSVFVKASLQLFEVNFIRGINVLSCFFSPLLVNLFNFTFFDTEATNTLSNIFKKVCANRRISGESRGDLIDILNKMSELSEDCLASLPIQLLLAGHETTGTIISFLLYELCCHVDVQNRLREEIEVVLRDNDGDISYITINKMSYMDMVINETLRKYPALGFVDRRCVKNYKVSGTDLIIENGIAFIIPTLALHYDERYFSDPGKFDPERFSAINKSSIPTCAYMPFGNGMRYCTGNQLALLMLKIFITKIIKNFKIEQCKATPKFLKFDPLALNVLPLGGKLKVLTTSSYPDITSCPSSTVQCYYQGANSKPIKPNQSPKEEKVQENDECGYGTQQLPDKKKLTNIKQKKSRKPVNRTKQSLCFFNCITREL